MFPRCAAFYKRSALERAKVQDETKNEIDRNIARSDNDEQDFHFDGLNMTDWTKTVEWHNARKYQEKQENGVNDKMSDTSRNDNSLSIRRRCSQQQKLVRVQCDQI